jgi:chromosome partitioning protein
MRARIIATANSKGGVGKSTIAVHLALWLFDQGEPVALIDADHQKSSSLWARRVDAGLPVHSLDSPDEVIEQAKSLARQYRHLIIDGPAGLDEITRAMLLVADMALIPCGPSLLDVQAAGLAVRVLQTARLVRDGKPDALFVCNKVQTNTRLSQELLESAHGFGVKVAGTALHLRQIYADAVSQKTVVTRMGWRGKEAATEITQLFQEVYRGEKESLDVGRNDTAGAGISAREAGEPTGS